MKAGSLHRLIAKGLLVLALASIGVWFGTREHLPARIRIATAAQGGLYQDFARVLKTHIERRSGRPVELVGTAGSLENRALLESGRAELAILQTACVPLQGLSVLAPLYPEVVHVIVRRGGPVRAIEELSGRRLALGLVGSGMRESARILLEHYRLDFDSLDAQPGYFGRLPEVAELDGAVVTTGLDNPELVQLLAGGAYELLPIEDAPAIALRHPLFQAFEIPRGLYCEGPPVPAASLPTLATTAVLAAGLDCSDLLVETVLASLYEEDLRTLYPMMIPERDALERAPVGLHPAARRFLDPYGRLSTVTTALEALAGLKELMVGLIALGFLGWDKLRGLRDQRRTLELKEQKERLDNFLERTMAIERRMVAATRRVDLQRCLSEVTEIKLQALRELTLEELRGDRMFSIFLTQCADVASRLQLSLMGAERTSSRVDSPGAG